MIQSISGLHLHQSEQYNITQTDQEPLRYSSHSLNYKFIKQLDFQQNSQQKIQRRINKIINIKTLQQTISNHFFNKIQHDIPNSTLKTEMTDSGQTNEKQFQYNGHHIKGRLRRRMLNGDTLIIFNNGKQFEQHLSICRGLYQNGKMIAGKFDFKNGYEYWGELNGKKFNGKGTLKCPDGKKIIAIWKNSQIQGSAKIQYSQGDVYYGEVQNFMKHGKGYILFKSGSKYVGNFKHGQINGYGTYFSNDGTILKGEWRNGELIKQEDQQFQLKESILNISSIKSTKSSNDFFASSQVIKPSTKKDQQI